MAEEFIIKSQAIEDKINQLLPSQGGFAAGVDFSASTMVMPIIDLTETAEGSQVRQDLQKAQSLIRTTQFSEQNGTTVVLNTTGYYEISYVSTILYGGIQINNSIQIEDDFTSKKVVNHLTRTSTTSVTSTTQGTIMVFLAAGNRLRVTSNSDNGVITGTAVQVADLSGNLTEVR